jgi:hypothetical protein
MRIRTVTREEVEIDLIVHPEDFPVKGNLIDSGDPEFDRELENQIIDRLDNGDVWAWCVVELRVTWEGFKGTDFLGGCSYDSERDFIENSMYYEDMIDVALEDLNAQITKSC